MKTTVKITLNSETPESLEMAMRKIATQLKTRTQIDEVGHAHDGNENICSYHLIVTSIKE